MAHIVDKLVNLVANLGTKRDKQTYSTHTSVKLDPKTLDAIYDSNGYGGKYVDIPVEDMFKNWATVASDALSPEQITELSKAANDLLVSDNVAEAATWGRLYGGAIIVMGVEGAGAEDTPLNLDQVGQDSLKFLHVIDRNYAQPSDIDHDISSPNYRKPEFYTINGTTTRVHHTRVLRFIGRQLPWRVFQSNNYWGAPVLQRVYEELTQFNTVSAATATMIHEANLDVVQIKGFANMVSNKDGQDKLLERFGLAGILKSNQNLYLLDQDETYDKKSNNFTGLKDMNDIFAGNYAGVADIPITRLMGQAPGGLNATGDSDLENYYNMAEAQRSKRYEPEIRKLYDVLIKSTLGLDDVEFEFDWPPIGPVSEKEQAEIENSRADRDTKYISAGVIDQAVAAKELAANKTYQAIDKEFLAAVEESVELESEMEDEDRERRVKAEEAQINGDTNSDSAEPPTE